MSHQVIIDQEKCIGCGACVKDCVAFNIKLEEKKAVLLRDSCIYCGHCEAVCPKNAVQITGFEEEPTEITEQTRLDPQILMDAIKTRRTIRRFTDAPVSRQVIRQIIEAGRYAPTGGNSQNISYIVLDKRKDQLESMAVSMFRKLMKTAKPLASFIGNMEMDDNFFFKKAPLVILIVSPSKVDGGLVAENMAFMAEANGLGVLFSGFFTMCANTSRKIRKGLGLKKGQKVVTTLVIGYPDVKYHRTVRREKAKVTVR